MKRSWRRQIIEYEYCKRNAGVHSWKQQQYQQMERTLTAICFMQDNEAQDLNGIIWGWCFWNPLGWKENKTQNQAMYHSLSDITKWIVKTNKTISSIIQSKSSTLLLTNSGEDSQRIHERATEGPNPHSWIIPRVSSPYIPDNLLLKPDNTCKQPNSLYQPAHSNMRSFTWSLHRWGLNTLYLLVRCQMCWV